MPRFVRRCWMTASFSGRTTEIAAGPRTEMGHGRAAFAVRNEGAVEEDAVTVSIRPSADGLMTLIDVSVRKADGTIKTISTTRKYI